MVSDYYFCTANRRTGIRDLGSPLVRAKVLPTATYDLQPMDPHSRESSRFGLEDFLWDSLIALCLVCLSLMLDCPLA